MALRANIILCTDIDISVPILLTQQIGKLRELRKCQCLAADTLGKPHLPERRHNCVLADG